MRNIDFPSWLQDRLNERNWRTTQLAKHSRISDAAISRILNGQRNAGPETLTAFAKAFNIPVEEAFRAAGLLPEPQDTKRDQWVRRIEHKLEKITDEDDRQTIEGLIDILSPDKKERRRRHTANHERSS
jgi:transcriptional regulator with XRE-family HTH domain